MIVHDTDLLDEETSMGSPRAKALTLMTRIKVNRLMALAPYAV